MFFFSSSLLLVFTSFLELTRRDGGSPFDVADAHFLLLLDQYIPKKQNNKKKEALLAIDRRTSDLQRRNFLERQGGRRGRGEQEWEPKEASGDQAGSKADLISTSGVSDVGSAGEKCGGLRWSPYRARTAVYRGD